MSYRFETASGLRLYACNIRLRMGKTSSIQFLDPNEQYSFSKIELVFETKTLAKQCRLNNIHFIYCLHDFKIVPSSLFLHVIDDSITNPNIYILRKHSARDTLANHCMLF